MSKFSFNMYEVESNPTISEATKNALKNLDEGKLIEEFVDEILTKRSFSKGTMKELVAIIQDQIKVNSDPTQPTSLKKLDGWMEFVEHLYYQFDDGNWQTEVFQTLIETSLNRSELLGTFNERAAIFLDSERHPRSAVLTKSLGLVKVRGAGNQLFTSCTSDANIITVQGSRNTIQARQSEYNIILVSGEENTIVLNDCLNTIVILDHNSKRNLVITNGNSLDHADNLILNLGCWNEIIVREGLSLVCDYAVKSKIVVHGMSNEVRSYGFDPEIVVNDHGSRVCAFGEGGQLTLGGFSRICVSKDFGEVRAPSYIFKGDVFEHDKWYSRNELKILLPSEVRL